MFDHVKFGVSDYAASRAFYLKALGPLGVVAGSEGEPAYGIELCLKGNASLCLFQASEKTAPLHLAFAAGTRQQVDAFHRAALAAGGRDNGAPGLRPQYHANYYAAFVIDPDGHNIEAVCHEARPSLLVRAATPADTPLIADIHTRSRASAYRGMLSDAYLDHQMPAQSAQLWQEKAAALAGGAGQAFIAEAGGEALAFVCVLAPDDERSAYIDNLHALPDRKGGGAGTALLDAAAQWARTHGATRMHLRVIDRNEGAIGFYEARGWQCIGQLDDVMGGTPIRARVYALALNQVFSISSCASSPIATQGKQHP